MQSFGSDKNIVPKLRVIPPSPTAAALGKYIDFPVSHYTGIPQIQIPLYNIEQKNMKIPISLSYHAKGNKVEDISSWIGLGWSLNAGGVITRAVKGIPDDYFHYIEEYQSSGTHEERRNEYRTGLFETNELMEQISGDDENEKLVGVFNSVRSDFLDLEPDMFYVNCFSFKFRFVFDRDENLHLIPQSDKRVIPSKDGNGKITAFTVIDEEGNKFIFNRAEISTTAIKSGKPGRDGKIIYTKEFNSSWYLSKVIDLYGNEIDFIYEDETISYETKGNTKLYYHNYNCSTSIASSQGESDKTDVFNTIQTKRLKTITWDGGLVSFTRSFNRQDLTGAKALTNIEVHTIDGELIRGIDFSHSYFVTTGNSDNTGKRLKLESIQEYSVGLTLPPFNFYYNSTELPDRLSDKVDFWGFYSSSASSGEVTTYYYPDYYSDILRSRHSIFPLRNFTGEELVFSGVDRNSNENDITACILEKIEYPTGGYTEFEYGCHEFQNPLDLFDLSDNIEGGGVRIEAILHSSDGSDFQTKKFYYNQSTNSSLSSGKIIRLPQFASSFHRGCWRDFPYNLCVESQSLSSLGDVYGSHVGYSEVKEEELGNGYIWYKYKMPGTFGINEDIYLNGSPVYKRSKMKFITHTGYFCNPDWVITNQNISYPYPPNSNLDWYRGLLEETTVYQNNNEKVQKIEYNYDIKAFDRIPATYSVLEGTIVMACHGGYNATRNSYFFADYNIISPWVVLTNKREYTYDPNDNTKSVVKTTEYSYDGNSHKQKTSIKFIGSEGKTYVTSYKYPKDYFPENISHEPSYHDESILGTMIGRNIISRPIEVIRSVNNNIVEGTFTKFEAFPYRSSYGLMQDPSVLILPNTVYTLALDVPLSENEFVESKIYHYPQIRKDPNYLTSISYDDYDTKGNSVQVNSRDGITTSYLWSYGQTLPIAKLTGAKFSTNATLSEASYIGFESNEKSNNNPNNDYWSINRSNQSFTTDAKVGKYAWYMTSIYGPTRNVKPASQSCKYTFSGWAKTPSTYSGRCYFVLCANDANGKVLPNGYKTVSIGNTGGTWKYFEVTIDLSNVTSTISTVAAYPWKASGSELFVDELRLRPTSSLMETYTYKPLVGMTSQTDANGITACYECDNFCRLDQMKNADGEIVKKYYYHYYKEASRDGGDGEVPGPYFSVSPSLLRFMAHGGMQSFTIESNTDWIVTQSPTWVTLSKTSGSGNATIVVTCPSYSSSKRSDVIVIQSTHEGILLSTKGLAILQNY